ncbi:MAG: hypothetical protein KDA42_06845 [Planctomycetales bacterium]|nr:hypothetical protein [Planctomycetales bacterium]
MSVSDQAFIKAYGASRDADLHRLPPLSVEANTEPRYRQVADEEVVHLPAIEEPILAAHIDFQLPGQVRLGGGAGVEVPVAGRAPLSSFAQTPPVHDAAEPAFEVEGFRWPEPCNRLVERAGKAFETTANEILADDRDQNRVIAVGGVQRGEGRSTAILCLARQLAIMGAKTALVDAHFANPALAIALGLAVEIGWEAVIGGEFPLSDALVLSKNDLLTLLPLRGPTQDPNALARSIQIAVTVGMLRDSYDRVLVDIGPVAERNAAGLTLLSNVSTAGVLVVRDARKTLKSNFDAAIGHIRGTGAQLLGVAETFVRGVDEKSQQVIRRATAA